MQILLACGVARITAEKWAPAFAELMRGDALSLGEAELDDFLGQVLHESMMLGALRESMNYAAGALIAKFGRHRISEAEAWRFGRTVDHPANQEALANILYGGDFGREQLGNMQPGDGWKYRGAGPIQVTGRGNMVLLTNATGFNLVDFPELLATDPRVGLAVTIRWWEKNLPDSIMGNLPAVTKRVNGGANGLEDRREITEAARRALAA